MFCQHCGNKIPDGSVFCNGCGGRQGAAGPAPAPPAAPPTVAAAPAAPPPLPRELKCSSCGAPLMPGGVLALIVCEYCGAVTTMGAAGAQVFQKHFMLDNRIAQEAALESGGKWLNKGLLRRKVAERSDLGDVILRYVPYWIIPTSVVADYQGTKGAGIAQMRHESAAGKAAGAALFALQIGAAASRAQASSRGRGGSVQPTIVRVRDRIQLQYNLPIVAVRGFTKYQPDDGFQFQVQNKHGFDKRKSGGVEVMSGDIAEAEAKQQAAALAQKFAEREARKRVDTLESIQVYPTALDGELLHAPVWFMSYAHKGKPMFILVDGHTGVVMDGERPSVSLF